MSDVMTKALEALQAKLDGNGFDGSIKIAIDGEGALMIDGDGARIEDGDADCTLTADLETFQGMMDGDVDPTSAFMGGALKVDGDMGQAMKLGSLLS